MVPVEEEQMPTTKPCVVVGNPLKRFTPEVPPIRLLETFTFPVITFIPHKIPFPVVAPLDVVNVIAAIVLFCTLEAVSVATDNSMPTNLVAIVPAIVVVPVPAALVYPITLLVNVYPLPEFICIDFIVLATV